MNFTGFIWLDNDSAERRSEDWERPGDRISVWAPSIETATEKVVAQYGDGHVIILYDEEDLR